MIPGTKRERGKHFSKSYCHLTLFIAFSTHINLATVPRAQEYKVNGIPLSPRKFKPHYGDDQRTENSTPPLRDTPGKTEASNCATGLQERNQTARKCIYNFEMSQEKEDGILCSHLWGAASDIQGKQKRASRLSISESASPASSSSFPPTVPSVIPPWE